MKRKTVFNIVLILSLILGSGISMFNPARVAAQGISVPCYTLNARDFQGSLVTASSTDYQQWFTWTKTFGGDAETYTDAAGLTTSVRTDIYPEVSVQAGVPSDTYRVWVYQAGNEGDRSLETTVGTDAPVRTDGTTWLWVNVGTHTVSADTVIKVKAVGAFVNHGQDVPERRGGFRSVYLTTDLSTQSPAFTPDGQTTCSTEGSIEFFDNFESYPLGSKLADIYEYAGVMGWGNPNPAPQADLFQVGVIGSNQVFKYDWNGPSYHYAHIREFYEQRFTQISEVGATYLYTQPSMGWVESLFLQWNDSSDFAAIIATGSNKLELIGSDIAETVVLDLWPDKIITQMSHRLNAKRLSDTSWEVSVRRLDTNEQKSAIVNVPVHSNTAGYRAGFGLYEDWGGGVHNSVDDFYVRGTPLTSASLVASGDVSNIYPGDPVSVDFNIQDADELYAAQAICSVDPSILEPLEGSYGDFFDPVNRLPILAVIDAQTGEIEIAISQRNPADALSGEGNIATIDYVALASGSTGISCDTLLADRDGNLLPVSSTGTTITVIPFGITTGIAKYQGQQTHAGITVTATGLVTLTVTTTGAGNFSLDQLKGMGDNYQVKADAPLYLSACKSNVVVNSGQTVTLTATTLPGGDLNDDDVINIGDATRLGAGFGTSDPGADINTDTTVNVQDLAILGGNFGTSGCQNW